MKLKRFPGRETKLMCTGPVLYVRLETKKKQKMYSTVQCSWQSMWHLFCTLKGAATDRKFSFHCLKQFLQKTSSCHILIKNTAFSKPQTMLLKRWPFSGIQLLNCGMLGLNFFLIFAPWSTAWYLAFLRIITTIFFRFHHIFHICRAFRLWNDWCGICWLTWRCSSFC